MTERQSTSFDPITTWSAIQAPRQGHSQGHGSESSGRWPVVEAEAR